MGIANQTHTFVTYVDGSKMKRNLYLGNVGKNHLRVLVDRSSNYNEILGNMKIF